MPDTLAAFFLAHVLADYVFQTKHMAASKNTGRSMLVHIATVWVTAALCTGSWGGWALLLLAGTHLIIDLIKGHAIAQELTPDGAQVYLLDQSAHLVALVSLAALFPTLFAEGLWGGRMVDASGWMPRAMMLLASALYVTRAGGFAVAKLMGPIARGLGDKLPDSVTAGGAYIGHLERGMIFLLVLVGQPAGVGFLIAAKSVLRFDATSDNARAEYVIIGTLASFGWAIAVSIGTLAVLNMLGGLPLLEIPAAKP